MEYENIRIDTTDISKIAQNTGMPEWKISRIKDHVFKGLTLIRKLQMHGID